MKTSMKVSWILWYIVSAITLLMIIGLVFLAFKYGLSTWSEAYRVFMLVVGVFLVPVFVQAVWLIINLVIGNSQKKQRASN